VVLLFTKSLPCTARKCMSFAKSAQPNST